MRQVVDGYEFDFPNAIELYKFDQHDNLAGEHRHGVSCMKAVDVMAEFKDCYVWIEIKGYEEEEIEEMRKEQNWQTAPGRHVKNFLRNNLIRKFRDTFLYRYCEGKVDKDIFYICLLNFDSALLLTLGKDISLQLPVGNKRPGRWQHPLLKDKHLFLVNEETWARHFSERFGSCRKID